MIIRVTEDAEEAGQMTQILETEKFDQSIPWEMDYLAAINSAIAAGSTPDNCYVVADDNLLMFFHSPWEETTNLIARARVRPPFTVTHEVFLTS